MRGTTTTQSHGSGSSIPRERSALGEGSSSGLLKCTDIQRRGVGGAARQETALLAEGVEVGRGSLGERTVDFSTYGWFPERLPSEGNEEEEEEDS